MGLPVSAAVSTVTVPPLFAVTVTVYVGISTNSTANSQFALMPFIVNLPSVSVIVSPPSVMLLIL